jgi:ABC-type transport system substrate-binding protein
VPALGVNLETGASGMALFPALNDALRLQQDPKYQVLFKDTGYNYGIWANTSVAPTDNKLVRQALNYAIDRNRWVQSLPAQCCRRGARAPVAARGRCV